MKNLSVCLTFALFCNAQMALPAWGASADPGALELARRLNNAFIEVADAVSPAVVVVRVACKPGTHPAEANEANEATPRRFRRERIPMPPLPPILPMPPLPPRAERPTNGEPIFDGQGSGVVIREDGYLLTNFHVVENAERVKVRFKNGRVYEATIRGTDPQSDLAVLKINAKGLPTARLGNSDMVRVGEFAIAIGAPFELENSVTFGHVSAKGRSDIIGIDEEGSLGAVKDQDFIQTDASINPGNSGGPLVNISGEIIGINTLIQGIHTGIGFAVPSNLAREIAEKLITDGKFIRPWLGVGIRSLLDDEDYHELLGGVDNGVVISSITEDSPAAKSELKAGDVVTSVDGRAVATVGQLRAEIRGKKIGAPVTFEVLRPDAAFQTKPLKVKLTPEAWPEEEVVDFGKDYATPADNTHGLGLTLANVTRALAAKFELDQRTGVIVTAVHEDGIASRKGVLAGDIVAEVNLKPVANLRQFEDALKAADLKKGVMLKLAGDGVSRFEVLRKERD